MVRRAVCQAAVVAFQLPTDKRDDGLPTQHTKGRQFGTRTEDWYGMWSVKVQVADDLVDGREEDSHSWELESTGLFEEGSICSFAPGDDTVSCRSSDGKWSHVVGFPQSHLDGWRPQARAESLERLRHALVESRVERS